MRGTDAPLLPFLAHSAAIAGFAALAVVWTYPLASHAWTHVLGADAGDNVTFVWNFWWMRAALERGRDFYQTTYLFAPLGADLTLHTNTALLAFVGATALVALPIVAALNVTVIGSVWLSAVSAYLLAWRVTRVRPAAVIAGLVYGGSPFMSAHLYGHFNLTTAWTLPLFAWAALNAIARGSTLASIAAGVLLGITAYVDYYFVVFEAALALALLLVEGRVWHVRVTLSPRWGGLPVAFAALVLADAVLIAAILATGGFTITVGGTRVSAHGTFNPLQALWILAAIALWLRWRPTVSAERQPSFDAEAARRATVRIATIAIVAAAPVIAHAVGLFVRGEYETQRYLWRNAPKGIDAATFVLGNPFHPLWGSLTQRVYDARDISAVESCGWLGIVPAMLLVWVVRQRGLAHLTRTWTALGGLFLLWSLGPHLMAFGVNTGLILPQVLLRYLPIVSNARIPGRAMIVVYLAVAVLCAIAVAELRSRARRRPLLPALAAAAIFADYVAAPFPLLELRPPAVYDTLRDRGEPGIVCELPLGIRDGFGESGNLDERVLFYQSIHQRPITGGFVARLPQRTRHAYESDPLLSALLRLSTPGTDGTAALPDAITSTQLLRRHGIRFIVLDKTAASAALVAYLRTLPLAPIADDAQRAVFIVRD